MIFILQFSNINLAHLLVDLSKTISYFGVIGKWIVLFKLGFQFFIASILETIDFHVLILSPMVLLNLPISSNGCLTDSFSFLMQIIILFANRDCFTTSFLIQMSFIYFPYLLYSLGPPVNRNGKSGHSGHATHLKRNAFIFSPLSMMLAASGLVQFSFKSMSSIWSRKFLSKFIIFSKK